MRKFSIAGKMPFILFAIFLPAGQALADDWTAVKLRGGVFEFHDGGWHQLARGATVPDDRVVRTMPDGRVEFQRGVETIDMGPNTQIRIYDQNGRKFTVVQQHFGEVSIEAEKRQIQHFVVQTEYVAAIVKGTRFTVRSGNGRADVTVDRGEVEVRDVTRNLLVRVRPGQTAGAGGGEREVLTISGRGELDQIAAYKGDALADNVAVNRSAEAMADVARVVQAVKSGSPVPVEGLDDLPLGLAMQLTDNDRPVRGNETSRAGSANGSSHASSASSASAGGARASSSAGSFNAGSSSAGSSAAGNGGAKAGGKASNRPVN